MKSRSELTEKWRLLAQTRKEQLRPLAMTQAARLA